MVAGTAAAGKGIPIVFSAISRFINYRVYLVVNGITAGPDAVPGMESDSICGRGLREEGETNGRPSRRPWTHCDPS